MAGLMCPGWFRVIEINGWEMELWKESIIIKDLLS